MEWYSIVTTILTIVAGGGWFVYYRANKRIKFGEATKSEAEGWKAMQDLYQQTISDFKVYSEDMRTERTLLKTENAEMLNRYKQVEDEILVLKKKVSRQARKLDAMSPFLCSVINCTKRKKFTNIAIAQEGEAQDTEDEND